MNNRYIAAWFSKNQATISCFEHFLKEFSEGVLFCITKLTPLEKRCQYGIKILLNYSTFRNNEVVQTNLVG